MQHLHEIMLKDQIIARNITDQRVLAAIKKVPRHLFVPRQPLEAAYQDNPLPIGHGQTISQPYIVALMSELCKLKGHEKVLEIGTGSGYQTAILSLLAKQVYTIEVVKALAQIAEKRLTDLGYTNIHACCEDGFTGWPQEAPFDVIMLTASPPQVPQSLIDQLANGGILVAPEGDIMQELITIEKENNTLHRKSITLVRFVPMVHSQF